MQMLYVVAFICSKQNIEGARRTEDKAEAIRLSRQPPATRGDVLSEKVLEVVSLHVQAANRILWSG